MSEQEKHLEFISIRLSSLMLEARMEISAIPFKGQRYKKHQSGLLTFLWSPEYVSLERELESTGLRISHRIPEGWFFFFGLFLLCFLHQLINSSGERSLKGVLKLFIQIHSISRPRYQCTSIWPLKKIQHIQQISPATQKKAS